MVSDRLAALDYSIAIGIQLAGGIASNMGWDWVVFAHEAGRNWAYCSFVCRNIVRNAPQTVFPLRSWTSDFIVRGLLDTLALVESNSWF